MWTNTLSIHSCGIITYHDSDHLPTFIHVPVNINKNSSNKDEFIKISFRLNNCENRQLFTEKLSNHDWSSIESDDIDHYFENFTSTINNMYCSTFPLKTKCISLKKATNPWYLAELHDLVKNNSTYFDMYRLSIISNPKTIVSRIG